MTKLFEINAEQQAWLDSRPDAVKAVIAKYPPNLLYRMRDTGQRVTLYSYSEDGTVTVNVSGEYNLTPIETRVFGVDPVVLEECELPPATEVLGTLFTTEKEIEAYGDMIRPGILAARKKAAH